MNKQTLSAFYHILSCVSTILFCCIGTSQPATALSATHYADHSILRDGEWIKIATTERGVYRIDKATLKSWGFDDASKLSLYGQNGYMLPETFSEDDTDDLVPLPIHIENGDLYFYASGYTKWEYNTSGTWTHTNNYYSNIVYYFLTQSKPQAQLPTIETSEIAADAQPMTTFDEYIVHEKDDICIGQTGRLYLGENLLLNNTVTVNAPDAIGEKMYMYIALGANASSSYNLTIAADGATLYPNIAVGLSDSYTYLKEGARLYTVPAKEQTALAFNASGAGNLNSYYLDYVRIFYTRRLSLSDKQIQFRNRNMAGRYYAIDINEKKADNIRVWNVTNVNAPYAVTAKTLNGQIVFQPETDIQEYIAFDTQANLPTPDFVCKVEPQDLHGISYIPDMVIVTTRYFIKEAERIAQFHRETDNMKVIVCDQLSIFNEFSGGTPDATAIRRMMKMFYDRAEADLGNPPRYLLLYGRGSYNNRMIAPSLHQEDNRLLVTYQSPSSTDSRYSYVTDDYFAYLADNSGSDLTSDTMMLGVGRMPVANMEESQKTYRKLIRYAKQPPFSNLWKNKCCFIGLNGDTNLHIRQMDLVSQQTVEQEQPHMIIDKVYLSAFSSLSDEKQFVGARDRIYRDLNEGCILMDYMGHAGPVAIGGSLMTIADARSLNNPILPIFITATCDVCPFDKDELSVGEALFKNENGGFIALYTTTRTVYTNGNENINRELLHQFFIPGIDGKVRLGDVMRIAKNALTYNDNGGKVSDPNKLKYCLIGDPALAVPQPWHEARIESINDNKVTTDAEISLPANSTVTIKGAIYDSEGNKVPDFNGKLCFEVYDGLTKEKSSEAGKTIAGRDTTFVQTFFIRNYKLATATDTVANGTFSAKFRLPEQSLQNGTNGLISLYAYSNDKKSEAKGYSKSFVINGIDTNNEPDITAPIFTNVWIGSPDFREGDAVEANSTFHCEISDDESGLNNNELSIGKGMTLWLDGKLLSNDLSGQYAPTSGFWEGCIDYPLTDLGIGTHTLTIKAFDNAGNSSEISVSFTVEAVATDVYELCIEEDPVVTQATISLTGAISENFSVRYVISEEATGKDVWTTETSATQIVWNLQTHDGTTAVPSNYLCQAFISADGSHTVTAAKKLIVLGQ